MFGKDKDDEHDDDTSGRDRDSDRSKPGGKPDHSGGDDGWNDGDDFDSGSFGGKAKGKTQDDGRPGSSPKDPASGADGDEDGASSAFGGKAEGKDGFPPKQDGAVGAQGKKPQLSMDVQPHKSGDGHTVKLHGDVEADLPGDGDYQHHVREHSKHYAGYMIHKDSDPERAEAHRHAANIHARIGNALHAGGDTAPRKGMGGPMGMGMPGQPGMGLQTPGMAEEDGWQNGSDFDPQEPSPGEDAFGGEHPAKPDDQRNLPPRDSLIEADRSRSGREFPPIAKPGGKPGEKPSASGGPPLKTFGDDEDGVQKSLYKSGGPFIGPKGGKWADAAHTIPWHDESAKHHELHIYSTGRGKGVTDFSVIDPSKPGGQEYHTYYGVKGDTAAERKANALAMHAKKHGITKPIKNVDFRERSRQEALADVKQGAGRRIKVSTMAGAKEVVAHERHGNYASHNALGDSDEFVVSHVPSGSSMGRFKTKDEASAFARHMHEHAPDALSSLKLGASPTKKHAEDMEKLRAAHRAWTSKKSQTFTLHKAFGYSW